MLKAIIAALFGATLFSGLAAAQSTCASYPYPNPLTDGTTADGAQVYANFTAILNCANTLAPLASPHFTGSVGIGTTSPVYPLDVNGVIRSISGYGAVFAQSTGSSSESDIGAYATGANSAEFFGNNGTGNTFIGQGNAQTFIYTGYNQPIALSTNSAERMRITGSGNIGIGTTSPFSILQVHEATNENIAFLPNYGLSGASGIQSLNDGNTAYESLSLVASQFYFGGGGIGIGTTSLSGYTLLVNGAAGGTTNWTNISDARLKKNVTEISDALSLVKRLRGVRYDWRTTNEREVGKDIDLPPDEKQIGFIAQEVATVVPEAVVLPKTETKYRDKGGKETTVKLSNSLYGLKEAALVPVLVEAIKEQQGEIETLKSEVAALKSAKPSAR